VLRNQSRAAGGLIRAKTNKSGRRAGRINFLTRAPLLFLIRLFARASLDKDGASPVTLSPEAERPELYKSSSVRFIFGFLPV
jgi:hypothetical protein